MSKPEILRAIAQMSPAERSAFLAELQVKYSGKTRPRKISELRGLGKSVWQQVSVEAYLKNERNWKRDFAR
ncbi:MAG: hypothetical protein ACK5DD_16600 [Cyclobacteriaceae bacterium]|jgi:hypothetical protein